MQDPQTVYDRSLEHHQEFHRRQNSGKLLIRSEERSWEQNRHGLLKWYLHPAMADNVLQSHIYYVQEIPAGGATGVQRHPGGMVIYFWKGRGHTILDGETITWKAEDVLLLPLRSDGVLFQHFNESSEDPVLLLAVEPNLIHALGVDRGSQWEQVEPAPEIATARNTARGGDEKS